MDKMMCPKCKGGDCVVALEDGVWMCTDCTIEFDEDGRACGGYVGVGEAKMVWERMPINIIPNKDSYLIGESVSAPRKDGTVMCVIRLDSVGNLGELARKLYESLKRASE